MERQCYRCCNSLLVFFLSACDAPLGMEDGRIRASQLFANGNAGGTYSNDSRMGIGKGWCSERREYITIPIYLSSIYLQVDLFDVHKITKLSITGAKGYEVYVPGAYAQLSYKVDLNSEYIFYKVCCHFVF